MSYDEDWNISDENFARIREESLKEVAKSPPQKLSAQKLLERLKKQGPERRHLAGAKWYRIYFEGKPPKTMITETSAERALEEYEPNSMTNTFSTAPVSMTLSKTLFPGRPKI
jgi:hypothetical protein